MPAEVRNQQLRQLRVVPAYCFSYFDEVVAEGRIFYTVGTVTVGCGTDAEQGPRDSEGWLSVGIIQLAQKVSRCVLTVIDIKRF
jgi:hypothetical protein|eukprot:COSAG02_NODE_5814_length_4019_cov_2.276786_3_plen_84_part_00